MKWQHTVIAGPYRIHEGRLLVESRGTWCNLQEVLDYFGSMEWELVSLDMMEAAQDFSAVFKRPTQAPSGPGLRPDPGSGTFATTGTYGRPAPPQQAAAQAQQPQPPQAQQSFDPNRSGGFRRRSITELNSLLRGAGRR